MVVGLIFAQIAVVRSVTSGENRHTEEVRAPVGWFRFSRSLVEVGIRVDARVGSKGF